MGMLDKRGWGKKGLLCETVETKTTEPSRGDLCYRCSLSIASFKKRNSKVCPLRISYGYSNNKQGSTEPMVQ